MQHAVHEVMFEFAKTIQQLVNSGWTLGDIDYGERRWDIGPSILVTKGSEQRRCYCESDFKAILQKEHSVAEGGK